MEFFAVLFWFRDRIFPPQNFSSLYFFISISRIFQTILRATMSDISYFDFTIFLGLMERLMIHNDMIPTVFLSQQFRSNKLISNWSNGYFYQNRLKSWPHVESICLQDLLEDHDQKQNSKFLQQSLVFIDTSHQQGDILISRCFFFCNIFNFQEFFRISRNSRWLSRWFCLQRKRSPNGLFYGKKIGQFGYSNVRYWNHNSILVASSIIKGHGKGLT